MNSIRKVGSGTNEFYDGRHRYEHWYRDNQVYFITARCRERFPAFASDEAKEVFWDRFDLWTQHYEFFPWVVSVLDNHYHVEGYARYGSTLGEMMRRVHGSVAKLVNDTLPERRRNFWSDRSGHDYFDGCLRDELQGRRTFRYVLTQCKRHGICGDPKDYPHTRVYIDCDRAIRRAVQLDAFLAGVPYARYQRERRAQYRDPHGH